MIVAEGGPVGTELLAQEAFHVVARNAVGGFEVPCRDDDRWLADDPVLARDQLGKLRQRLQAVARASALVKPLLRPATVKLAASRFTSYSNGPGRVSSKSLRSNSSRRSGEANSPKLDGCASPQSWTCRPAVGVPSRSAAMTIAAPR